MSELEQYKIMLGQNVPTTLQKDGQDLWTPLATECGNNLRQSADKVDTWNWYVTQAPDNDCTKINPDNSAKCYSFYYKRENGDYAGCSGPKGDIKTCRGVSASCASNDGTSVTKPINFFINKNAVSDKTQANYINPIRVSSDSTAAFNIKSAATLNDSTIMKDGVIDWTPAGLNNKPGTCPNSMEC